MATVEQKRLAKRGGSIAARELYARAVTLTMAAGATVSDSLTLPEGAWLEGIQAEVATAITGTPTNINLRVGTAAAGQEVVADTDVKAQGHFNTTIVASFDKQTGATTYYFRLAAVGGTNPAGTVNVIVKFWAAPR